MIHSNPDDRDNEPGTTMPLTVLLLHAGTAAADIHDALSENGDVDWYVLEGPAEPGILVPGGPGEDAQVQGAVRRRPASTPPWRDLVTGFGMTLTDTRRPDSEGAVLLVRSSYLSGNPAYVAFCFGGASRSIPAELTDNRFGLIVALNKHSADDSLAPWRAAPPAPDQDRPVADPAGAVRRVTADARSGYRHRLTAAPAGAAPVSGLRLDVEADHMRGVTVRTGDSLMRELDGSRALHLSTPIASVRELVDLADYLMMLRQRTDYRLAWEWIDQIVEVDPGPEFDQVLTVLIQRIGSPDEPHIDLAMPDLAEQTHRAQRIMVAFPGERGAPYRVLPEWPHLRTWLVHPSRRDGLEQTIRKGQLRYALESDPTGSLERHAILDLLQTELDVDGRHYLLQDGSVYRIDPDYIKTVDDVLSGIPLSTFPYPAYRRTTEGAYLDDAPKDSGYRLAELDERNIRLPGQTPFEPCDLVTDGGTLVFAKPKGKSSHFSHLGTQAAASIAVLRNVPAARDAFLQRVREATTSIPNGGVIERAVTDRIDLLAGGVPEAITVCFLVLGTWRGTPDIRALPLQSRIMLRGAVRQMQNLGCRVEFALPRLDVPRPPAQRRPTARTRPTH